MSKQERALPQNIDIMLFRFLVQLSFAHFTNKHGALVPH
jgi:hypothetical protein